MCEVPAPKVITKTDGGGGTSVSTGPKRPSSDSPRGPVRNRNNLNEKAHSSVFHVLTKQTGGEILIRGQDSAFGSEAALGVGVEDTSKIESW